MLEPGNLRKALASSFLLVMITSWDAINCLPVTAGWAGLIRSSGKCAHKRWTVPYGTMHQYLLPMWTVIPWDKWYGLIRGSGLCAVNEQLTVSDSRWINIMPMWVRIHWDVINWTYLWWFAISMVERGNKWIPDCSMCLAARFPSSSLFSVEQRLTWRTSFSGKHAWFVNKIFHVILHKEPHVTS